ncbi:DUF255 domain-containing protein [Gilvimarinus sp. SDUM040013]|nr:DUF255 domain-containing protein [Gilvimarinus sp. SDUM040013]MDO3387312.1 DUF255 domain-containing protein [Gilvimarinus sp. SDUM040013]
MKLAGLFIFVICISFQVNADAVFKRPPSLPEREKTQFDQWNKAAKRKNEDKVFSKAEGKYLNALVNSSSPYLRQHAKNPVNWKPWRSKYLEQAKAENKLIFLSIGYSTCHWCHTMAKESFSDAEVAKAVNSSYIAIKIDREELPQIDRYYASLLEAVKGSAGWPITAIINSEGLPIYIDSYLPKDKLINLLTRVDTTWKNNPEFLLATARTISELVAPPETEGGNHADIDTAELLNSSKNKILTALDSEFGGLKGEVKFPQETLLLYLLDELRRSAAPDLEKLLLVQLNNMMNGGIRDHVDGGFHRYSTDKEWIVPHYEKMLYNQALMAQVYLEAWQVLYDEDYQFIATETLDFAIEHLYQAGEGFYSALDADFKGEEGGFYLWAEADIEDALEVEGISYYSFKPADNKSNRKMGVLSKPEYRSPEISKALNKLSQKRHARGDLHRDDKVITSWNGLMIHSLAMASRELNREDYLKIAQSVGDALWVSRFDTKTGKLFRTSDTSQELFSLEDYAYLSRGYVGLYDVTQNPKWLDRAKTIYYSAKAYSSPPQLTKATELGPSASPSLADGELMSPIVILQEVELALKNRTLDPKLFKPSVSILNQIKSRASESTIGHISSLTHLNNGLHGSSGNVRYFANGMGRFSIVCAKKIDNACASLALEFTLNDGWHINSNTPLQDYLKPTIVESSSVLTVEYPEPITQTLGFQREPLSLFAGEFSIVITKKPNEETHKTKVNLPLQACNDEICLLPEKSVVIF